MRGVLCALLLACALASSANALSPRQETLLLSNSTGPSMDCNFAAYGKLAAGPKCPPITFSRASNATYFDASGTMQTAATNVARFDHNPTTGAALGLLVEEQRTNLLLNSATLGTQSITVAAVANTLSFYGTGTVALSGTCSGTLVGGGVFPTRSTLSFTPTAGTCTAAVTGTVTDAQVEVGAFATSYISTSASAATRAADVADAAVGPWFRQGTGTFVVYANTPISASSNVWEYPLALSDGTNNNQISFWRWATNTNISSQITLGGASVYEADFVGAVTPGTTFKIGISYAPGVQNSAFNGTLGAAGTASVPTALTSLSLGRRPTGDLVIDGYLQRLRYYPRAMPATELQGKTQ